MSIDRAGPRGPWTFCCDNCGETYEALADNWDDALADAKSEEWRARHREEEWKHFCSLQCERDYKP